MLLLRSPCSKSSGQCTNKISSATTPATGPASLAPIMKTYTNATAAKSASQKRVPNSLWGKRPARIGAATIQNFSGGFSRNASSSCGLLLGTSQSPISRMRSTENV